MKNNIPNINDDCIQWFFAGHIIELLMLDENDITFHLPPIDKIITLPIDNKNVTWKMKKEFSFLSIGK